MEQQKPAINEVELTSGKSSLAGVGGYEPYIRHALDRRQTARFFDLGRV
jgi:hypothetical protein